MIQQKRTIIHVLPYGKFQGGIEQLVFDTANSLREQNYNQILLCEQNNSDESFASVFDHVTHNMNESVDPSSTIILCHDPMLILKYPDLLKYRVYLFVHDHNLVCIRKHKYYPISKRICDEALGFACIKNGCVVNRARGNRLGINFKSPLTNRKLINKLQQSNVTFIVGSQWMKHSLVKNKIKEKSITVINPITAQKTTPSRTATSRNNLLFVGQLVTGKGLDFLLNAMIKLEQSTTLDIIGDGVQRQDLEQLSEELGLQDRVVFHGKIAHEKVEKYYQSSKILIVPSRWPEPFGMVGLEAMRHGLPVIAFDVGGIPEWLTDNKNGLLVKAGDVDGLANVVTSLLANEKQYEAFSAAAYKTASLELNHNKYILDLLNVWGLERAA